MKRNPLLYNPRYEERIKKRRKTLKAALQIPA